MNGLLRHRSGTFHKTTCQHVTMNHHVWRWAEGKTLREVLESGAWNTPCKVCICTCGVCLKQIVHPYVGSRADA